MHSHRPDHPQDCPRRDAAALDLGARRGQVGAGCERRPSLLVHRRAARNRRWCCPKVPIATGVIGTVCAAARERSRRRAFPGGDLHAPVVLGRLYNEAGRAARASSRASRSPSCPATKHRYRQALELRIDTPGDGTRKVKLTLDGERQGRARRRRRRHHAAGAGRPLSLQQSGGSDGKAELEVGDSKVTIEQSGDVTIEAGGTLKLKATRSKLSGDTSVKIAGQTIDLN